MKQIRIIGLSLLALFALASIAATTASAEEGFLPLKLKGVTVLGTKPALTDLNKDQILCQSVTGTGAFTSDSHGTGKLDFAECEVAGFPAYSVGEVKPKTVKEAKILAPVEFLICLVTSSALLFGIWVKPTEPIHINVEALVTLIVVEGAVIGHILTTGKTKLFVVDFETNGTPGDAKIAKCTDENGGEKLHSLTANTNGAGAVMAAEEVKTGLLQFEEEVELMDK